METVFTASLPAEDLADLDRVCRAQRINRLDAIHEALQWYINCGGDLPAVDEEIEL